MIKLNKVAKPAPKTPTPPAPTKKDPPQAKTPTLKNKKDQPSKSKETTTKEESKIEELSEESSTDREPGKGTPSSAAKTPLKRGPKEVKRAFTSAGDAGRTSIEIEANKKKGKGIASMS